MTQPNPLFLHPEGMQRADTSRVTAADQRFERDYQYAQKSHTHLWIATVVHRMSQKLAEDIALNPETAEPRFDVESLATIEMGCFVCEQTLTKEIVKRRCPGEPR